MYIILKQHTMSEQSIKSEQLIKSNQLIKKFDWLEPTKVPQKGYSKCFSFSLQRCEACDKGVYTLHQPHKYSNTMVCGWCFDAVENQDDVHPILATQ